MEINYCPNADNHNLTFSFKLPCWHQAIQTHCFLGGSSCRTVVVVLGKANAPPAPHLLPIHVGVSTAFPWQLPNLRLKTQPIRANGSWRKIDIWEWGGTSALNPRETSVQIDRWPPSCPSGIFLSSLDISLYIQYTFPFFNNNLISQALLLLFVLLFEKHWDSCIKSRVQN